MKPPSERLGYVFQLDRPERMNIGTRPDGLRLPRLKAKSSPAVENGRIVRAIDVSALALQIATRITTRQYGKFYIPSVRTSAITRKTTAHQM
jgi:hypothetical protein